MRTLNYAAFAAVAVLAVSTAAPAVAQSYQQYGGPYLGNQSASAGLGFVDPGRVDGPRSTLPAPCATLQRFEASDTSGSLTKLAAARRLAVSDPAADVSACPSYLR